MEQGVTVFMVFSCGICCHFVASFLTRFLFVMAQVLRFLRLKTSELTGHLSDSWRLYLVFHWRTWRRDWCVKTTGILFWTNLRNVKRNKRINKNVSLWTLFPTSFYVRVHFKMHSINEKENRNKAYSVSYDLWTISSRGREVQKVVPYSLYGKVCLIYKDTTILISNTLFEEIVYLWHSVHTLCLFSLNKRSDQPQLNRNSNVELIYTLTCMELLRASKYGSRLTVKM